MINVKRFIIGIALLTCVFAAGICSADSDIPNLVGTWTVKNEGAVIFKDKAPGAKTHFSGEFSAIAAEVIVTKQQGRVFHGTFTSPKTTEKFVGVIGMDNKSIYLADEDGFIDGKIVTKDRVDSVYRHVTSTDTAIGVGTWTRKK